MKFTAVTPYGKVFEGDVKELYFRTKVGSVGLLDFHCPYFASVDKGFLRVRLSDGTEKMLSIPLGGVVYTEKNICVLLSEKISV